MTWLDASDIRYSPKVKLTGKSGFDHLFHFLIPRSRQQPQRLLHAINHPDRRAAQTMLMAWTDTREVRAAESRAYALLNDVEQPVHAEVLEALRVYQIQPVLWSERDGVRVALAA